jgi:SAM-dependent methyltransferase
MTTTLVAEPEPALLDEFIGHMIGDLGATVSAGLVVLGDRLGLYKAMADGQPVTAEQLASRTGTAIAYVRPWLANQAAGGYLNYHPETATFSLSPEQAAALALEDSPAFFAGAMQLVLGALRDLEHIEHGFRTGEGFGWHEHDPNLFEGTERFFRPGYATNLVESWLPALNGVVDKLVAGATVVDVGCGHGASTILMAQAFPKSSFLGTDYHEGSIRVARRRAAEAGVEQNVTFEAADANELAANSYDLVAMFDCLHDMGDPDSVARAVRRALRADGTLLLVEPFANDRLEDNLTPVGRVFYGGSTLICTPCSLAQPGARALGPQAGPSVLTNLLRDAGFTRVRVANESPVNLVFEARP